MKIYEISELELIAISLAATSIGDDVGLPDDPEAEISEEFKEVAYNVNMICKIVYDVKSGNTKRFCGTTPPLEIVKQGDTA